MGAWGSGNLENDGAQDILAGVCDELFGRVIELLRHPRAHEYDDFEFDDLRVRLEMIFALHDRGMINTAPDPDELQRLCSPFLKKWADYYIRTHRTEPSAQWRGVLEDSFTRLIAIATSACQGSFEHRLGLIADVMSKPAPDRKSEHPNPGER